MWIQTRSGKAVELLNPDPDSLDIRDVAFSLSRLCRYTGHVPFYSVAQHSVLCSRVIGLSRAYDALMHDAHEAAIGDITQPIKYAVRRLAGNLTCPLATLEDTLQSAYEQKFKFDGRDSAVRECDLRMLQTERLQLLGPAPMPWGCDAVEPYLIDIVGDLWSPERAEIEFLNAFYGLAPDDVLRSMGLI